MESPEYAVPGFRKYLPPNIALTEEEHDLAVDRFFRYYASWGQRTHPVLFREDMHVALYSSPPVPKTPHYSPMLHNAILAIALCFSDNPYLRLGETRNRFAAEAKNCVEQEGTSPTVATVQALLHLASYHSTAAEHNIGWLYMGMALRCALAREYLALSTALSLTLDSRTQYRQLANDKVGKAHGSAGTRGTFSKFPISPLIPV